MSAAGKRPLVFLDTSSLLDSSWNRIGKPGVSESFAYSEAKDRMFWGKELKNLLVMGEVVLPKKIYDELVRHSGNTAKSDLAARAGFVLRRIMPLVHSGEIAVVGDANDPFADAIMLSVALKFRTQRNMAFVTQDRKLAQDLEAVRHFASVDNRAGYDIKIRRVSEDGSLKPHRCLSDSGQRTAIRTVR